MAFDLNGNLSPNNDDTLLTYSPNSGNSSAIAKLPLFSTGLAIDDKRGRIYVAQELEIVILAHNINCTILHTTRWIATGCFGSGIT